MSQIMLQNVVISFPHLFEAKQYEGQGAFRYSGNFIFPADYNFTELLAAIEAARIEKGLPEGTRTPLSQVKSGPYAGQWTLAAYAYEYAPQVVDQNVQPLMDRSLIWAGCRVHANVDIYGHNKAGGGVTAGLTHVMIVDNVESVALPRLDSRKDAADIFQPVQGAPVATAPGAAPIGVPVATQPGVPVATQPGVPVATQPGVPVATQPGAPVATQPGAPVATQPGSNLPPAFMG